MNKYLASKHQPTDEIRRRMVITALSMTVLAAAGSTYAQPPSPRLRRPR